jgi:hypothetical protein
MTTTVSQSRPRPAPSERDNSNDSAAGRVSRSIRRGLQAMTAGFAAITALLLTAGSAFAATGASGASAGGTAPGLSAFTNLTGWVSQYGWAGAPLAISLGGLLMTVEHHQQRTGNAIRAKGYIFAAGAGLIVISLAGALTNAMHAIVAGS